MPFKDPEKRREAARIGMQKRRASEKGLTPRVNVNPVNPASSTVNHTKTNNRISLVSGQYESGYWCGICPVCNHQNKMDPRRSFRPFESCEHLVRLEESGKASPFVFKRGLTHKSVNPVNPSVNPRRYLLSYSRNKYQFVLYSLDIEGKRSLLKSYHKDETLDLGNIKIRLTWGPDLESIEEVLK
jgi:hypothetical protein